MNRSLIKFFGLALAAISIADLASAADKISFSRDIRPILSNQCFKCHGPDEAERKAGLRLDVRDVAVKELESGERAVVPGQPATSELVRRIRSADPNDVMPPPGSQRKLSGAEKDLLAKWIGQGAEYQSHWSFIAPKRPPVPAIPNLKSQISNPIDAFVVARLDAEGLSQSPPAAKEILLRRVSLDLTGLPPTLVEIDAFLADKSPDAYEKVVDRLLASPRFGERMAQVWLDVARYADTNGYNNDEERVMWRWRDWVIEAFNRNLPFDRFVVEQLAGDMLPDATPAQRLATGFNRNHVLTTEGGIIDEEYRIEYVADRVQTTAAVFMGLTLQCARCHDHKFDPVTQREYFQLFAFFNSGPDRVLGYNSGAPATPYLKAPTELQQTELTALDIRQRDAERRLADRAKQADEAIVAWEKSLSKEDKLKLGPLGLAWHFPLDEGSGGEVVARGGDDKSAAGDRSAPSPPTPLPRRGEGRDRGIIKGNAKWIDGRIGKALEFDGQTYIDAGQVGGFDRSDKVSFGAWVFVTSNEAVTVLSKMHESAAHRGYDLIIETGKPAVHIVHHWPDSGLKVIAKQPLSLNAWHQLLVTYDGSSRAAGVKLYVDGQPQPLDVTNDKLGDTIVTDKPFHIGRRGEGNPFRGRIDDVQFYRRELAAEDATSLFDGRAVAGLAQVFDVPAADRTAEQGELVRRYYIDTVDEPSRTLRTELAEITKRRSELDKTIPTALVMEDLPQPRKTHVLKRGQYDQPGDEVSRGVPESLPTMLPDMPRNRLGLAKWLVDPSHPLTARVSVNRWWAVLFGTGLVETEEDFGAQGAFPSHPELLDWLATEYVRIGWNTKALLKLIVTSATYRQSSRITPELRERDPANRLLARGPRFRLPAETVRDNALAVSGLLVERLGGPSVKPYQPAGLWEDVSVERRFKYEPAAGPDLYRRSMYTYWKRTCPPPGMTTLDAPDREFCVIRRARTNTPMQALLLMNDPTYLEAARKLAERVVKSGPDFDSRLALAFRTVVARRPTADEVRVLRAVLDLARTRFESDPAAAGKLLSHGASPRDEKLDVTDVAAWTTITSLLLCMDETITKG
jgi:hypothetical protein